MQVWIQEAMAQVAALQQYGVICIVLSGFAFTGFVSLNHSQIKEDLNFEIGHLHVGAGIVFGLTLSMACCISAGLYATLIFTLCSIYGAVAVSHGDSAGFAAFMARTGPIRHWAFIAFKGALISMISSIMLLLLTKIPFEYAIGVMVPALLIICTGMFHAARIMGIAGSEFEHATMASYHKHSSGAKKRDVVENESLAASEESSPRSESP